MKYRLLKFDIIHPTEYLDQKKQEWKNIDELSLAEYRIRLIKLRSNYSDFYTYHLDQYDDWTAEEFFLMDDVFMKKVEQELLGKKARLKRLKFALKKTKRFKVVDKRWHEYLIRLYIAKFKPDVIFVRSHPLPSSFWKRYRKNMLVVARLSARLPKFWHPNDWDMIYTDQPDFKTFFELHGVNTIINDQGFDKRIVNELIDRSKRHDLIFIGGLGTNNFVKRTTFFNQIAQKIDFKWWGYWWRHGGGDRRTLEDFPALEKTFHGSISGIEMFQLYKDAKIVANDYVDTANGIGFNQRMFEVMGSGAFMLTREAPNFEKDFPPGIFGTFNDETDFVEKVAYYLKHEEEREAIAKKGQEFILSKFDYSRIVAEFKNDLETKIKVG